MDWFLLGIHYGLVVVGILVVFIIAFLSVMFVCGVIGGIVNLLVGEGDEDDED